MLHALEDLIIWFSYFREGLGEGYDGDVAFASALETFGGGHNDPICVAFGGMLILSTAPTSNKVDCVIVPA